MTSLGLALPYENGAANVYSGRTTVTVVGGLSDCNRRWYIRPKPARYVQRIVSYTLQHSSGVPSVFRADIQPKIAHI